MPQSASSVERALPSSGSPDEATVITRRQPQPPAYGPQPITPFELGRMLAGERLNHFELVEYVGGGGMGAVFRARDTMLNREVAVKVLSRDQGSDEEAKRRFRNEAQSAARLDHENIARVYYVGEDRGLNYIVFEFIEGVNLRQRVEQHGGALPLAETISYTLQIARALDHASNRDVVHRDIKPSNVLITHENRAKLVDMGLARLHQVETSGIDLTASGVTLGTFDYISPEQARDPRSADIRSDIYSLGCTVYFMLTARPPFPDGTVLQKLLQHNSEAPPDPRECNPAVPDEVAVVLNKMLAKNPLHRQQSAVELIADLLTVSEQLGLSEATWSDQLLLAQAARNVSPIERHLPWLVPMAILVCVVIGLELFARSSANDALFPNVAQAPNATTGSPAAGKEGAVDTSVSGFENTTANKGNGDIAPPPATSNTTTPPADGAAASQHDDATSDKTNSNNVAQTTVAEKPPVEQDGLLVVGPAFRYPTLRAACSEAKNGDVIELRFNGPQIERPVALNNLNVTIRAAESFRPTLVFKPDDDDALAYARSMVMLSGGSLTLANVDLELQVPSQWDVPAETWCLFELRHSDHLELQHCLLTVRNMTEQQTVDHPDVAFFRVSEAPGFDTMMPVDEAMSHDPVRVTMRNCVARGEAVFLRDVDLQPLEFSWDNGLLVTTEQFLTVEGGKSAPTTEDSIKLSLRHLTLAAAKGFCRLTSGYEQSYQLPVNVACSDSILVASGDAPLVEQEGKQPIEAQQRLVTWEGSHNFFQGFSSDAFWRIVDLNQPEQPQMDSFVNWTEHQNVSFYTWGQVVWKQLASVTRPSHLRGSADYALNDEPGAENAALKSASDRRDAGMVLAELPATPLLAPSPVKPEATSTTSDQAP